MGAQELGYKQGREYLCIIKIEKVTFAEYYDMGGVVAQQRYKRDKAREEFILGWHAAGEQFIVLFKLDDANQFAFERRLAGLRTLFGQACVDMETLLGWRKKNSVVQGYLQGSYQLLDQIQNNLDCLAEYLKPLNH